MRVHVRTRNRMHQSAIVLVRCVPSAAILEKTLGTRLAFRNIPEHGIIIIIKKNMYSQTSILPDFNTVRD